jgi:K+-transporting ATPase ATPase A chain
VAVLPAATDGVQFVALLVGTIVIVGSPTFLPALALGPIAEHFAMIQGNQYATP